MPRDDDAPLLTGEAPLGALGARALVCGGHGDPLLRHLRPLIAGASAIDIVAAFVQDSGLALLEAPLLSALERGVPVRLLTGDYLHITQAGALQRLLGWQLDHGDRLQVRIIETAAIGRRSFHPKAWRLDQPSGGVAFVGSSNISRSALTDGIEWNLRLDGAQRPRAYAQLRDAFGQLWAQATPLTAAWLASYRQRARAAPMPLPPWEVDDDDTAPPTPRPVQREALAALALVRADGGDRALVVMATGLGKTFLAAFDAQAATAALGRPPRILFVAHRVEILRQALDTFCKVMPTLSATWCAEGADDLGGDLVLAGIQKLSRRQDALTELCFDYVVIDEVHHAAAASYRGVLDRLRAGFRLGLTATPERSDGADILGFFDDVVAYRAELGEGIRRGALVPFRYFGLRDPTDFSPIPWRGGRFEPEALARAVQTQARMARLWEAWGEHPASRTVVFCCTIDHADFVRDWLREKGQRVVSLHSGPKSADREQSLEALGAGRLDAVAVVDLLNEGVDVREIDRVVMLRPTGSSVLFLQQLGRGLRTAPDKDDLVVLDFVGNHHVFLSRVRTLLSLSSRAITLRDWLERGAQPQLPEGCDISLEATDLLTALLPARSDNHAAQTYRELRTTRGRRPTAGALYRRGLSVRALGGGQWFAFADTEGDLSDAEQAAWRHSRAWLARLQKAPSTHPAVAVVRALHRLGVPDASVPSERLEGALARDLLRQRGGEARLNRAWPADPAAQGALQAMTAELLDLLAARARARLPALPPGTGFFCRVTWNQRDPILSLPSRATMPDLPLGETDVRLPDGRPWRFRFAKAFVNVARPVGSPHNQLPDLLRRWFGPAAGHPGTRFQVRLSVVADTLWIAPHDPIPSPRGCELPAFPDTTAAANAHAAPQAASAARQRIRLPGRWHDAFALRVVGDSMDGGDDPIRDGDWAILRWARAAVLPAVEGQVALVAVGSPADGTSHLLKRVRRHGSGFRLCSDNPDHPPILAPPSAQVLALKLATVRPEALAPPTGAILSAEDMGAAFGVDGLPGVPHGRRAGLLFVRAGRGMFSAPERLVHTVPDRQPGERAYVLADQPDGRVRFCGVARWDGDAWRLPALDFATWRALGEGRSASRALAPAWTEAARAHVAMLLETVGRGGWVRASGKAARIVARAARGGLRIDGGEGGFKPRTVSLTDIGWVLCARAHVDGQPLDEATVNRLRYLEGTPRGSTRWIDTGWAIVLTQDRG